MRPIVVWAMGSDSNEFSGFRPYLYKIQCKYMYIYIIYTNRPNGLSITISIGPLPIAHCLLLWSSPSNYYYCNCIRTRNNVTLQMIQWWLQWCASIGLCNFQSFINAYTNVCYWLHACACACWWVVFFSLLPIWIYIYWSFNESREEKKLLDKASNLLLI